MAYRYFLDDKGDLGIFLDENATHYYWVVIDNQLMSWGTSEPHEIEAEAKPCKALMISGKGFNFIPNEVAEIIMAEFV